MVLLNADDARVREMEGWTSATVTTLGQSPDADVRARQVLYKNGILEFTVDSHRYRLSAPGTHLLFSALVGIHTGRLFGLTHRQISSAITTFEVDHNRGAVYRTSTESLAITLIDDSYNASPASVEAAVSGIARWDVVKRRVVVLGDMLELQPHAVEHHFQIGQTIARAEIDAVFALGEFARHVQAGFCSITGHCLPGASFAYSDRSQLTMDLIASTQPGDLILVKGCRGLRMEQVVDAVISGFDMKRTRIPV